MRKRKIIEERGIGFFVCTQAPNGRKMSTPENKVKNEVKKLLDKYEIYYFLPATHGYGRSGVPDIVCCVRVRYGLGEGQFLAIECKAGDEEPTELQKEELANINAAGGEIFVINEHNLHELEEWLKVSATLKPAGVVTKKSSRRISLAE